MKRISLMTPNFLMPRYGKNPRKSSLQVLAVALLGATLLPGCARDYTFSPVDMWNRSRLKPYEPVNFFDNNLSSRPLPAGTVARGNLQTDDAMFRGVRNERFVTEIPAAIRAKFSQKELEQRGQERYNIYCTMCHGAAGHGDGMVVQRGFSPPPDYRIARLRQAPVGHFFNVITHGYGAMYSYSTRVPVQDRWAIAAYIRSLQRVQPEVVEDVRYKNNARQNGMNGSGMNGSGMNGSGMGGSGMMDEQGGTSAAPQNTGSEVGAGESLGSTETGGSASQSRTGQQVPGSKNPMQAVPPLGTGVTEGLRGR